MLIQSGLAELAVLQVWFPLVLELMAALGIMAMIAFFIMFISLVDRVELVA
jgi:hypothetical protein